MFMDIRRIIYDNTIVLNPGMSFQLVIAHPYAKADLALDTLSSQKAPDQQICAGR
jgi:hypothetical protein